MRRNIIVGLLALGLSAGCVERAPELSPAERERLNEFVTREAPSPDHELVVRFDNGVSLLGYDASAESITPGQPITITWYWHAEQDMDDGWQMFTHIADADDESRLNQDHQGVVRELYQPGRWQAGDYIRDVQEVTLPDDWNSDRATFYLGLWNGPHRLAIRSGQNDGENRVRALSLPVRGGTSAQAGPNRERDSAPPPPSLRAARLDGELTIDGNLDEAAWRGTQTTASFVNTVSGGGAPFVANARTLWDDDNLYVGFTVEDDFIQSTFDERDAHLWEQDAVEIMIDPDGDGRNYFELQVSPTGKVFDTRYDTVRQPRPFGHTDWNADVVAAAHVEGTANDDAADTRYTVEVAIPWGAFATGEPPATRPAPNAAWRINFYVMDQRQGDDTPDRSAGWGPTLTTDFHVPARFGRVLFGAPLQAAAEPVAAPEGEEAAAESPGRPRAIPLPPGTAAAVADSLNTNARLQRPGMDSILADPDTAARLQEAMRARQARQAQAE